MVTTFLVILLVVALVVAIPVFGTGAFPIVSLVILVPMFARWLHLTARAGPLRFDLGRPEKGRYLLSGVATGFICPSQILIVGEDLAAGRLAQRPIDLWFLCVFALVTGQLALTTARGVSIREAGVLTGDYFVPWKHVTLWICEPGAVRVTMQFEGVGVGGLLRFEPIRDISVVWALPTGVDGADVAAFLAERVPPRATEWKPAIAGKSNETGS
jgi:hypothetical protein